MRDPRDLSSLVDELGKVGVDARAQTAELRSELKEARRVIKELRKTIDEGVNLAVDAAIAEQVRVGLERYQGTVREAMDRAVEHVKAEFDKLFMQYVRGRRSNRDGDLRDLMGGDRG